MPATGPRKVVKYGGRTGHQFCIDGYMLEEVLKSIPKKVKIIGAEVEVGTTLGSRKIPVPNAARRVGVQRLSQTVPKRRAFLVFDEVAPDVIIESTKKACKHLDIDYKTAQFREIKLQYKGAVGIFTRTTKEIKPYSEDLRKKLKVLGLRLGQGKVSDLISALGAKKYYCDFHEEIVRVAICRPE